MVVHFYSVDMQKYRVLENSKLKRVFAGSKWLQFLVKMFSLFRRGDHYTSRVNIYKIHKILPLNPPPTQLSQPTGGDF